jgi:hypothetical protein
MIAGILFPLSFKIEDDSYSWAQSKSSQEIFQEKNQENVRRGQMGICWPNILVQPAVVVA